MDLPNLVLKDALRLAAPPYFESSAPLSAVTPTPRNVIVFAAEFIWSNNITLWHGFSDAA